MIRINCARIVWSPDSTKLACVEYSAGASKPSRLRLIDAATAATTTLATGFFEAQVSFSPDSARLAYVQLPTSRSFFSSQGKLQVIDLTTHAITTVRDSAVASPAWGPDAIAFAVLKPRGRTDTFDVATVQPDGTNFRRLTNFRPDAQLFGPTPVAWSADGKRLLAGMVGLDAWTAREAYAVDVSGAVRHRQRVAVSAQPGRPLRDRPRRETPSPPVSPAQTSSACPGAAARSVSPASSRSGELQRLAEPVSPGTLRERGVGEFVG